jgi:hypothetical protein
MQFSWANTLIDPTSLEMRPRAEAGRIDVFDLSYPPRTDHLGVWQIQSGLAGKVPMQITYLTSGLSWRPFYIGTLTEDETFLDLRGYVRVSNASGEDYENAQVRLIVGQVNLIDDIVALARRPHPYGSPAPAPAADRMAMGKMARAAFEAVESEMVKAAPAAPKRIEKKGSQRILPLHHRGNRNDPPPVVQTPSQLPGPAGAGRQPVQIRRRTLRRHRGSVPAV